MAGKIIAPRVEAVLVAIEAAALAGAICPTNAVLARTVGYDKGKAASAAVARLTVGGYLSYMRCGFHRVVFCHRIDKATHDNRVDVPEITRRAAVVFNTTARDILSPSRYPEHVIARHAVAFVARENGLTLAEIGDGLGRDFSTIRHAIVEMPYRMARSQTLRSQIDILREQFVPQAALAA